MKRKNIQTSGVGKTETCARKFRCSE